MRILALTDLHAGYAIAERIMLLEPADITVLGGDIFNAGTVKEVEHALSGFKKLSKQLLCVAGNMDLPSHELILEGNGISLNASGIEFNDLGFFGVSGAPRSFMRTPYEISEDTITQRLQTGHDKIQHSKIKIIVSHAPPYGTTLDIVLDGFHAGSTAVRDFVIKHQPDVVICGHIHEARGIDSIGKTKIVNCGPAKKGYYAIIDIGDSVQIQLCKLEKDDRGKNKKGPTF